MIAAESAPTAGDGGRHPRPQLVRSAYVALDRVVEFAHDDLDVGLAAHWERSPQPFARRIQLPYPPESPSSLIGDTAFHPIVWYRIAVTEEDLVDAGLRRSGTDRTLLHFGAVDHDADVWVDGTHVARHSGGQTPFTIDVSDALAPGEDPHSIVVRAVDDPLDTAMPRGKQDWLETPHSIWYERTTGIWRTVWLEAVPAHHIVRIAWTADPTRAAAHATVELSRRPTTPVRIRVELQHDGRSIGRAEVEAASGTLDLDVPIAAQRNGQALEDLLWTPETPTLIDARITLLDEAGEPGDTALSYLGIRSVGTGSDRFLLNERPRYLRAVLEQGYWPETHLAAPSSDALRREVELIKSLGFDTVRIHQKVEDARFLYWADRLGLMVWSEIASAYEFSAQAVERLTTEWIRTVRDRSSHPSIVTWVPFNESWGVQHIAEDTSQQAFTLGLVALTRTLDPTRPVISNDGWEHTGSDILTVHDYESGGEVVGARYGSRAAVDELLRGIGPAGRRMLVGAGQAIGDRPVMLTEFGGVRFDPADPSLDGWGYSSASDAAEFTERLRSLLRNVIASPVLAGFCWTQLTDTRQERNGLCDESRVPKIPASTIAAAVRGEDPGA